MAQRGSGTVDSRSSEGENHQNSSHETGLRSTSHENLKDIIPKRKIDYVWFLFIGICFITGQFFFKKRLYYISILLFLMIFFFVNLYSTGFNFYIMTCPFRPDCGYIDTKPPNTPNTPNASSNKTTLRVAPMSNEDYANFQKFIFTVASLSGTLSYFCMIWSLNYSHFRSLWKKREPNVRSDDDRRPLIEDDSTDSSTFGDFEEESTYLDPFSLNTTLKPKQIVIFWSIFVLNLLIYIASAVTFYIIVQEIFTKNDSLNKQFWDMFGLVSQFASWYCAILSCFIFSKLAYTVSNYCIHDLYKHLKEVNDKGIRINIYAALNEKFNLNIVRSGKPTDDLTFFQVLKDVDRNYVKLMKSSLKRFGTWFAIHWLCYTVTAFIAIGYFIQHVLRDIQVKESHCYKEADKKICWLSLTYDLLFCLGHCILFLYPCFRAASVTAARYKVIRKISRANWRNIPFQDMQAFLHYMEHQDCTFKVSIFCATATFGFNLAYFSIFAGIMTVILKISL